MELSFVEQEDILVHLEKLFRHVFREVLGRSFPNPSRALPGRKPWIPMARISPDLRFGLPIVDVTEIAKKCGFSVFSQVAEQAAGADHLRAGQGGFYPDADRRIDEKAFSYGAKGMAWIAIRPDGELYSVLTKYFSKEDMDAL